MKSLLTILLLTLPGFGFAAEPGLALRAIAPAPPAASALSNLTHSPDGSVYLTYAGPGKKPGGRALYLAMLANGAAEWTPAQMIVETPELMENWADFPSMIVGTDGTLWAQWFQKPVGGGGHGYSGWFARSKDCGVTWSEPAPLGSEFVSLAPLSGGRVLAVWLESTHTPRADRKPGDPSMQLNSRLLGPDGATLQAWTVDPDVCTCCQTTLTTLKDDRVFVAYRGHTREEIRDNHYALFDGAKWTPPQVLHDDGWQIPGCPVNGPAAASRDDALAVVWFTAAKGEAHVRAKYSSDGGAHFSPMATIDLGLPMGRVDIAMLTDASAVITWMETKDGDTGASIYARRLFPSGEVSPAVRIADSTQARASGFPRIINRESDQLVISWTQEGAPSQVHTREFAPPPNTIEKNPLRAPSFRNASTRIPRELLELCGPVATAQIQIN